MKERPILFSAPMVRAILEGRKTQTRRVITLPRWTVADDVLYMDEADPVWPHAISGYSGCIARVECPYGVPGDRLWVRETWTSGYQNGAWGTICLADSAFVYGKRQHEKGPHFHAKEIGEHIRWRPSIHMPRWASRITLEITDVRVQRLQEITDTDAYAEGCDDEGHPYLSPFGGRAVLNNFAKLWDSINGKTHPWVNNDWVWALTFRRVDA